jgi:AP-1 complex subunit mu
LSLKVLGLTRRNSNVFAILQFLHRVIQVGNKGRLHFVCSLAVVQVFKEYFFELEEESLRDNFVLVYELLDEMMDFGHPQLTESKILKEYITQQGFQLERQSDAANKEAAGAELVVSKASSSATSTVSWRPDGIKYRKNEVFLDVIESVNLTVNSAGQIIKNEVVGRVKIRCFLSGMPELRLGLNDKVLFELKEAARAAATATASSPNARALPLNSDNGSFSLTSSLAMTTAPVSSQPAGTAVALEHVKFHQCVRLARFEVDRTIAFIPPDGEFELLSYRVMPCDPGSEQMKPLFWVDCKIDKWSETSIEYLVTVRSQYKKRSSANSVEMLIPVPADADTPRLKTTLGTAEYDPEESAVRWNIGFLPGGKEFSCRVKMGLAVIKGDTGSRGHVSSGTTASASVSVSVSASASASVPAPLQQPIKLFFELPYYTMSGIQVRYLKIVEKSGYPALPWVRYITQHGQYHFRMPEVAKAQ